MQQIVTLAFLVTIQLLFLLDRDRKEKVSGAHWIPVLWLALAGSRSVSQWMAIFGLGGFVSATPDQYLEGSPIDRNAYLLLTILGLIVLTQRRKTGILLRANGPLLIYFAYCAISAVWSDHPDVTLKRWFKAVGDLVMVLIILSEANPVVSVKRLLTRVCFVLLPLSLLFIRYYPAWGRDFHPNGPGAAWQASYTGVTTSKNLLGMITLLLGVGSLWSILQMFREGEVKHKKGSLIAHCTVLLLVMYLFWLVNSATSFSCFLIAGGIIAVTSLAKIGLKPGVIHLLVIGMVSFSLFSLFIAPTLLGTLGRDSTLTGRTDIWKLALGMSGNALVGTGFESFWLGWRVEKVWNAYRFHLQEAHNGYLEIYLNLGWLGITLLAMLLVTGYKNLLIASRGDPALSGLRLAFFTIAVVYNLTEAAFRTLNPVWILFLLAIVAVPVSVLPRKRSATTDVPENVQECEAQVSWAFDREFRREAI